MLKDTLVVALGLDRGTARCTSDRNPQADDWRKIYEALRNIEEQEGVGKQQVVKRFK